MVKPVAFLIVKNEEAVIERCLDSLKPFADKVVAVDTGSTDRTLDILWTRPEVRVYHRPWVNFAHNRNEALRQAEELGSWVLRIDADQTLAGTMPDLCPEGVSGYQVRLGHGSLTYRQPVLFRSGRGWWYEGATHEYLSGGWGPLYDCDSLIVTEHADSHRRTSGKKLEEDLKLLEGATDPRSCFYYARTLEDLGRNKEAIAAYAKREGMAGWHEEVWYSQYRRGLLTRDTTLLLEAWEEKDCRWEPLYHACRLMRARGVHGIPYALSKQALSKPPATEGLFLEPAVSNHLMLIEHSLAAYHVGEKRKACEACYTILSRKIPADIRKLVESNLTHFIKG